MWLKVNTTKNDEEWKDCNTYYTTFLHNYVSFISREVESQAARRLECVSGSMNSTWSLEPGPAQHVVVGASVSHQASSVRRDDG